MAIDAVFLHDQGYAFNQIYLTPRRFLSAVDKQRNAVFVDAVDYEAHEVIRPSNLPDYRRRNGKHK